MFDAGMIVVIGFGSAFVGAIAWAEVHSRRRRRQARLGALAGAAGGRPPARRAESDDE